MNKKPKFPRQSIWAWYPCHYTFILEPPPPFQLKDMKKGGKSYKKICTVKGH